MKIRDVSFLVAGIILAAVVGALNPVADAQTTIETRPGTSSVVTTTPDGKVVTTQTTDPAVANRTVINDETTPDVIFTGDDVGLKIDHMRINRVVGTLVVRVDGKWQPVELESMNALAH